MFMFTSLICYAAVLCFMVCFSTYLRFCSAGISDIRPGSGVLFMYCVWLRGLYPSRSRPRSVVRVALLFSRLDIVFLRCVVYTSIHMLLYLMSMKCGLEPQNEDDIGFTRRLSGQLIAAIL